MRSIGFETRRIEGLRNRLVRGRAFVQIVVGALAIAAIALAFLFRPGQATQQEAAKATPVAVRATATVAAIVVVPPPTAVPSPAPPKERTHTVVSGDTLSKLSETYYGTVSKADRIYEANKDILPNPNSLQIGQKLRIPD